MSHVITHETEGRPSAPTGNGTPGKGELAPERRDELVTRARDILAGRLVPPPIAPPPGFLEHLDREFGWRDPPPTAKAIRFQTDYAGLDYLYPAEILMVCKLADDGVAVLGVGEAEVRTLLGSLSDDEHSRIITTFTEPYHRI